MKNSIRSGEKLFLYRSTLTHNTNISKLYNLLDGIYLKFYTNSIQTLGTHVHGYMHLNVHFYYWFRKSLQRPACRSHSFPYTYPCCVCVLIDKTSKEHQRSDHFQIGKAIAMALLCQVIALFSIQNLDS